MRILRDSMLVRIVGLLAVCLVVSQVPAEAAGVEGKLNINTATVKQLMMLPGIGKKTAERIVEYREKNGEFKAIGDLAKVKGVGKETMEKVCPCLALEGETTLAPAKLCGKININTATEKQLKQMPGIGAKTAQRIVEYRKAKGPFKSIDDITKVRGIGKGTFKAICGYLALAGETTLGAAKPKPAKGSTKKETATKADEKK